MKTSNDILKQYYEFLADPSWEGSAEVLAEVATRFGIGLGILENSKELTERLVRDYVQRGVIDKPEKKGKEAIYTTKHLDQILEARQLINSGFKLQALPELMHSAKVEAMRLVPDDLASPDKVSAAMSAFKDIKTQYRQGKMASPYQQPLLGTPSMGVKPKSSDLAQYVNEAPRQYKLRGNLDENAIHQKRFELLKGIQLVIDEGAAQTLSEDEIATLLEAIERIIRQENH